MIKKLSPKDYCIPKLKINFVVFSKLFYNNINGNYQDVRGI